MENNEIKEVKNEEFVGENIPETKTRMNPMPKWRDRSKASKAASITGFVVFGLLFVGLILLIFARQIFGDAAGDKLLGPGVENGFVWLWNGIVNKKDALIGTLLTIFLSMVIKFILDLIINLSCKKSKRGRTIGSLLKSLFKYIIIIIDFGIILSLWGVNVAGIVAGIGVLSLIIGLGCQSLVNDIVSGIFIVTDSYFEVGEMVIIDGFRGTVVSVGLRTTKLRDWCNNIKCIANSQITSVVNLSRYTTYAEVEMEITYDQDLRNAEAVISRNWDRLQKACPFLKGEMKYKGVTNLSDHSVVLYFIIPCDEENRYQTRRDFRRELYLVFKENNIEVPYNEVTVHSPSGIVNAASESDIKESKKFAETTHSVVEKKISKKQIVKKMVKSVSEYDADHGDEDED